MFLGGDDDDDEDDDDDDDDEWKTLHSTCILKKRAMPIEILLTPHSSYFQHFFSDFKFQQNVFITISLLMYLRYL